LKFYWEFEESASKRNNNNVGTPRWEAQQDYAAKVDAIPDEIRDAILEKWLTYCGSE
jgi:hypothetical protein